MAALWRSGTGRGRQGHREIKGRDTQQQSTLRGRSTSSHPGSQDSAADSTPSWTSRCAPGLCAAQHGPTCFTEGLVLPSSCHALVLPATRAAGPSPPLPAATQAAAPQRSFPGTATPGPGRATAVTCSALPPQEGSARSRSGWCPPMLLLCDPGHTVTSEGLRLNPPLPPSPLRWPQAGVSCCFPSKGRWPGE